MEQLHARADDGHHVELADADEDVAVQPRFEVRAEIPHVDTARWRRHLDDTVDQRVHISSADGDDEILELEAPRAGQASDITEVEYREVRAVGDEEVTRMRIGVIEPIAEDH